jgi:hypothetical protein
VSWRLQVRNEPVSQPGDRLNESRRIGVVAQSFPQSIDAVVENMFEIHIGVIWPETLAENRPSDDFSRMLKQESEHLGRVSANGKFTAVPGKLMSFRVKSETAEVDQAI